MYYLRTRPKADAIKFTVDQQQLTKDRKGKPLPQDQPRNNVIDDDDECLNCGA